MLGMMNLALVAKIADDRNFPPQQNGEADDIFRRRVAGLLRETGEMVLAHEVYQNARYDSPGMSGVAVRMGVRGAMATAWKGERVPAPGEGQHQIECEIAHVTSTTYSLVPDENQRKQGVPMSETTRIDAENEAAAPQEPDVLGPVKAAPLSRGEALHRIAQTLGFYEEMGHFLGYPTPEQVVSFATQFGERRLMATRTTTASSGTERKYATGTSVDKWKYLQQIEATIKKYGGTDFTHTENPDRIALMFFATGSDGGQRRIRYVVPLPRLADFEFLQHGARPAERRSAADQLKAYEAEINRIWRALLETIKGKFVGVESRIETLEETFWAHIVTPNNTTVWEETHEAIATAYKTGQMPELLPGLRPERTLEAKPK